MSIAREIKDSFRFGSNLTKIIYINLAVFVFYNLIKAFFYLFLTPIDDYLAQFIAVPADITALLNKPWTIFTYMFFHQEFLHILFNMLWLYWFGKIFLEYFSQKNLVGVYIIGGLSGGSLYIIAYNSLNVFSNVLPIATALGASASVLAIVFAVSTLKPNHTIYLLFLGAVKLKYLALFTILLDIISIPTSNAGGHIAHLGGALFGFLYAGAYIKGIDLAKPITWIMELFDSNRKPKSHLKVNYRKTGDDLEYNKRKIEQQARLDLILDKIAKTGYDSLSKEEKETLFKFKDNSIN